ncbi:hypothetical protein EME01_60710 [Sinorhizobium meliloti]|nr:hypothetical protein EME01_60710 [Sinorhizobium meliloti]
MNASFSGDGDPKLSGQNAGAVLPFTDLSVDAALGVDGIVLPRALHGLLL